MKPDLAKPQRDPSAPITILLVDDTVLIRKLLDRILRTAIKRLTGIVPTIIEADDTFHAESVLNTDPIDLMILDVMLPGKDGCSFAKELRAKPAFAELPIIICSVISEKDVAVPLAGLDHIHILPKPFSAPTVLDAVRRALGQVA